MAANARSSFLSLLLLSLSLHITVSADSPPSPSPSLSPQSPAYSPSPSPSVPPPSPAPASSPLGSSPPAPSPMNPPSYGPSPAPSPADSTSINHRGVNGRTEHPSGGGMSGSKKAGIALGVIIAASVIMLAGMVYKKRQQNIRRSQYSYATRGDIL